MDMTQTFIAYQTIVNTYLALISGVRGKTISPEMAATEVRMLHEQAKLTDIELSEKQKLHLQALENTLSSIEIKIKKGKTIVK